jgi:hypothetical protein
VEEKYDISIITKCSITQTQDPGGNEFKIDWYLTELSYDWRKPFDRLASISEVDTVHDNTHARIW